MTKCLNTYYTQSFSWKTSEFCPLTSRFLQVHRFAVYQQNTPLRLRSMHFSSRCFNCMQAPSLTINTDDWRKALLFRVKVKFRFFFFGLSFWSYFILFCTIFWQENETKGKGSLYTFYFKLQFIWASNTSVLFNSSGWYLSGFLKYNIH